MATLNTNLSTAPYYDDFDEKKNFQRILFKPGVSVQTRELNQLQSILQKQAENFGDAIFKAGTIVSGCNFQFKAPYPYIKLLDSDVSGLTVLVSDLHGLFIKSANSGLRAMIIDYADGFESTAPNLKTLYINYQNSGDSAIETNFQPGETLTVTDANTSLYKVSVFNGGVGFSNTDKIVVVPQLIVNVTTGVFSNGDFVVQPDINSLLQIVGVDQQTLALKGQVILKLAPRAQDLANATVNTFTWAVGNNLPIKNAGNTAAGTVLQVVGAGAAGGVLTDSTGKITSVIMTTRGAGFTYVPYVSVRSSNNLTGLSALTLTPQNYVSQVKVATPADSIGNGYAFGVSNGVIYQKGLFLNVPEQTVVVSKYDQYPNNMVVGFSSAEDIINSNRDPSLLDPVSGEDNSNAPGADRLRVTPSLQVVNKSAIKQSDAFLSICEWSEGNPYKLNQTSSYSAIGDEMARRTKDDAGDFVTDRFEVVSRSSTDPTVEGKQFDIVVDPGNAYISGYHVLTDRNYVMSVPKGTDTRPQKSQTVPLTFGNYIRISQAGGTFQFSTGDTIALYDTPKQYISNRSSATLTPTGTQIGTARIRSMTYEQGNPGTASAIYRLFLFNVSMSTGKSFNNVRSIYYNGINKGVADVVLELSATTQTNVAILHSTANNTGLLYSAGVQSLKNANNASYTYRTVYQDTFVQPNGQLVKSLQSNPNENFPFVGNLFDSQASTLYVVPSANVVDNVARSGTIATTATSNVIIGTGTTFISDFQVGDYLSLNGNTNEGAIRQVLSITNNISMSLDANVGFSNTAAKTYRAFPASVPMPFGFRDTILTANCDPTGDILTLNFGVTYSGGNIPVTLGVDVVRSAVGPGTKQANRDRFVAINLANVAGGTQGPWCLGIPDVFRLKAVYLGTNSSVSNTNVNVVNDFYIDTNQNPDYVDLSYLYIDPKSDLPLSTSNWLLVQFDHFSITNPGFYATTSYVSSNVAQLQLTDALPLANLGSQISTLEIPIVHGPQGNDMDLLNNFDFRPTAANTVPSSTLVAGCPVNPPYALLFGNTADPTTYQKFPNPASTMVVDTEQWLGRVDSVFCTADGNIVTLHGAPSTILNTSKAPNQPSDTMLLNSIIVPPYPTLAQAPSIYVQDILNTKRVNENNEEARIMRWTALTVLANSDINLNQPMGYDMRDIGTLDHRITALEYYVSLSELESDVTNRVIPSSVDPSTNRFKFAFFADDYGTNLYQQTDNPQYQAQIISDDLWPKSLTWTVTHGSGNCCHAPYVDWPIVNQTYASGPAPSTACYTDVTTSNTFHYRLCGRDSSEQNSGKVETKYFTFDVPANTGKITVYVWAEQGGSRMNIWQGNTLYLRGNNAVLLTASDKTTITADTFAQNWFGGVDCTDDTTVYDDNCAVPQCCKIVWTHNPTNGNTYTIVFTAKNCYMNWKVAVEYVVTSTVTQQVPCPLPPQPTVPKTTCTGHMDPCQGPKSNSKKDKKVCTGYVKVSCTGLKPKTKHVCQSDTRDISKCVRPIGGQVGDPIISDEKGKCTFEVLMNKNDAKKDFDDKKKTKRDEDHDKAGDHDSDKNHRTENISISGQNSYASCKSTTKKQSDHKGSKNNKYSR